jgi:putative ABC transport system substrate-binding protein
LAALCVWAAIDRTHDRFLNTGTRIGREHFVDAFHEGLKGGGFIEGQNVTVEYRWADGQYDRLSALADELVRLKVSVIVAIGSDAVALAAKTATSAIPIVFGNSGDPVGAGLVASLSRPGGNATGVSLFTTTLAAKRLELLRELVPNAQTIGVLTNALNPAAATETKEIIAAASSVGQQLHVLAAATEAGIAAAFDNLANHRVGGLLVNTDPFFLNHRTQIISLESRHRLPTVHTIREWTMAGGLMSYGFRIADGYRQAGNYTAQILKGAKPADMPVVQPTKFELVIIASGKSRKGGRDVVTRKPFIAVQRVRAASLAAIPVGESPTSRRVQPLL